MTDKERAERVCREALRKAQEKPDVQAALDKAPQWLVERQREAMVEGMLRVIAVLEERGVVFLWPDDGQFSGN